MNRFLRGVREAARDLLNPQPSKRLVSLAAIIVTILAVAACAPEPMLSKNGEPVAAPGGYDSYCLRRPGAPGCPGVQ